MYYGSSFVDLIVCNVVVQTKLKMDISKESYRILEYKIYEKNVCMWRVLFPIQTLMGHRRAAAGRAKGRALRRERDLTRNSFYLNCIINILYKIWAYV